MTDLQQGGNAPLPDPRVSVGFSWAIPSGREVDADASAYLLTAAGKVRGDTDMVFYNQPDGAGGAVRFGTGVGAQGGFEVDTARLPAEIERIVFCVTIHEAQSKGQTLALLTDALIQVGSSGGSGGGGGAISYRPALGGATEAAMIFGELYLRNGQWKFRAVGQGFNGGLAPLARSFGIEIAEDAAPPPSPPAAAPPPTPVRLSKVTLDKPGQTVSLEKRGTSFGEIVVNLNWSRGRKGFFGGGTAIDPRRAAVALGDDQRFEPFLIDGIWPRKPGCPDGSR